MKEKRKRELRGVVGDEGKEEEGEEDKRVNIRTYKTIVINLPERT